MMRVSDIDRINVRSFSTELSQLRIWDCPLDDVTEIKLLTAHKLLKNRAGEAEADKAIKAIIQGVRRAQFFGEIDERPIELRKSYFVSVADFNYHLEQLHMIKRRALLFALDSDIHIRDIAGLKWRDALVMKKAGQLGKVASQILETSVRHFAHELVFWYFEGKKAVAIYDIEDNVNEVTQMNWRTYTQQVGRFKEQVF